MVSIQRRQFLVQSTVAGTAGALGVLSLPDEAAAARPPRRTRRTPRTRPVKLNKMQLEHFKPLEGNSFELTATPESELPPISLVLVRAEEHALTEGDFRQDGKTRWVNGGNRVRIEPFVLTFSAPEGSGLPQGTYQLTHPGLRSFKLFLVPLPGEEDEKVEYYVACFT